MAVHAHTHVDLVLRSKPERAAAPVLHREIL